MKRLITVALAVTILGLMASGCSLFQPLAGEIAGGVIRYCIEPQSARDVVRNSINVELASAGH